MIYSFDNSNNPVTGVTFTSTFFINGSATTAVTLSVVLSSGSTGAYRTSWSSSTLGIHQYYLKNNTTSVIYSSDIYYVKPDNEIDNTANIYVGL